MDGIKKPSNRNTCEDGGDVLMEGSYRPSYDVPEFSIKARDTWRVHVVLDQDGPENMLKWLHRLQKWTTLWIKYMELVVARKKQIENLAKRRSMENG